MAAEHDGTQSGLHRYPPFDAVLARLDDLPRKQRLLARALLDEPEVIAFGSVREVAAHLDVNAATVMRFAQVLGYSGYQTMQAAVRRAYLQYAGLQPPHDQRILAHSKSPLGELRAQQRVDLDRVYEHLGEDELHRLCEALEGARRVLVAGDGAAAQIASVFVRLLHHVGIRAEHISTASVDNAVNMLGLGEEDVMIGLALWLPFRGAADTLRLARQSGATTIAITGSPGHPIARDGSHVVVVPAQGIALSFSVLPMVVAIEAVVALLATRRPQLVEEIQQALHDRYVEEGDVVQMRDLKR